MNSAGRGHGAMENGRRSAAPDTIAMMRSLAVVEVHEPVKTTIERRPAGEVMPAKDHAPVLGENRLLQALDEAVGPGVARLDARVADPERPTRRGEVPDYRMYDCRHTYASLLLATGAPITYVSQQLGHSSPSTTLKFYARWIPSKNQRWVDVLDWSSKVGTAPVEPESGTTVARA